MTALGPTVDLLHTFGDPTRMRLVALVAHRELSVADLVTITDLPQPRISTHLAKLREASVVRDRREGAMTYYALNEAAMSPAAKSLWELLAKEIDDAVLRSDRERCDALLRARAKKNGLPDAWAGQMEKHYSPGRTWESLAHALLALVDVGDVLDVGCGDGTLAQLIAPRARSVTCLDKSERMTQAARRRLTGLGNTRVVLGDMHALPFGSESFDVVLLFNVLTYSEAPARAVTEAARVLGPRGKLAIVTLGAHAHEDVTASYGHVNAGFSPAALKKLLARAELTVSSCSVACREKRPPHFDVVLAVATKEP